MCCVYAQRISENNRGYIMHGYSYYRMFIYTRLMVVSTRQMKIIYQVVNDIYQAARWKST